MRVKIHVDSGSARRIARKANQFGDGRRLAIWIRREFPLFDARASSETGEVFVWDADGNHVATASDEFKEKLRWSLDPGRTLLLNGRPMVSLYRQKASPSEADELAHTLVALLNKAGFNPSEEDELAHTLVALLNKAGLTA